MRKVLVLLGCMLPGVAWGADVRISLGASAEYDDNVYRSDSDREDDIVFRVTPRISLVEDRSKLNYNLGYTLPYEIGVKNSELRDLNHLVDGTFRYRLTPQTELYGTEGFYYVRGLYRQDQNLEDPTLGAVGDGRERVLQNSLMVGATHFFTPRLSGSLRVNNGIFDTSQFNRADSLSFGGTANAGYQLTPHHQVGGGFGYSRQSFDETFNRPASDTDYYNVFGTWKWLFDETTTLDVQVGPALIHSRQDAPPPTVFTEFPIPYQVFAEDMGGNPTQILVPEFATGCPVEQGNTLLVNNAGTRCVQRLLAQVDDPAAFAAITGAPPEDLVYLPGTEPTAISDTRITYFATASLAKRWSPTLASNLTYTRRDDNASGIDGGATLDALILTSSWRITDRWDFSVRGDWTQRQSATEGGRVFVTAADSGIATTDVGGTPFMVARTGNLVQIDSDDSLDTQRWGAAARIAYRLTKNTVTALQYAYNKQTSNGDTVGQTSDFDNHLVTFTVQYNFEPIGLWW